jgi:TPR repeat protein
MLLQIAAGISLVLLLVNAPLAQIQDIDLLKEAAEQGDAYAQGLLGTMYENGRGVPQDYQEAAKWYRKAAEQGNAGAQSMLGWMYEGGKGVPRDYREAAMWFRKAAEQGLAPAQFSLGTMYYLGDGVPQDYVQAHMWCNLAAANETAPKKSAELRDKIAALMTREQLAEAQKLAREWYAAHSKGQ